MNKHLTQIPKYCLDISDPGRSKLRLLILAAICALLPSCGTVKYHSHPHTHPGSIQIPPTDGLPIFRQTEDDTFEFTTDIKPKMIFVVSETGKTQAFKISGLELKRQNIKLRIDGEIIQISVVKGIAGDPCAYENGWLIGCW